LVVAGFDDSRSLESGMDGSFSLRVQPKLHQLALRKSGQAPRLVRDVDPGTGPLAVVLEPAVEGRGHVVRSDGRGISGVQVMVQRPTGSKPATATTDAEGAFGFGDLAPGPHMLYLRSTEPFIAESRNIEAPASDVRIELGPTAVVRGRVTDARTRRPLPLFEVMLQVEIGPDGEVPVEATGRFAMASGTDGAFLIAEAPAGEVSLTLKADGYVAKRLEGLEVLSGGDPLDLEIALEPGVTLRGRTTSRDGAAIADVQVVAVADGEQIGNAQSD